MTDFLSHQSKIKNTLKKNHFQIKKSLGQNYLINKHYLNIISEIILKEKAKYDVLIIEIGCGLGALTKEILKKSSLIGIEIDKNNCQILKKELANFIKIDYKSFKESKENNLYLLNEDILKININKIISPQQKIILVGNLPYHLVTQIIFHFLENHFNQLVSMILLMQKEVGEKLRSSLGKKNYSIHSIITTYYTTLQKVLEIPPTAFHPIPKIKSELIKFTPNLKKNALNYSIFKHLIKASFHLRRKKIYNSIKSYPHFTFDLEKLNAILNKLNIKKNIRGENLSLDNYITISNLYEK